MRRPALAVFAAALLIGAAPAATRFVRHRPTPRPAPRPAAPAVTAARAAELRDLDIAFWARRVGEDPTGAEDRAHLAALLLQRARETGDYTDYLEAESVARAALRARPQRDEKSRVLLASALMAQHRFAEAYDEARRLGAESPGVVGFQALRGEVALELGRYDEARAAFDSVLAAGGAVDESVAARVARWEEVTGRAARARVRLAAAARAAGGRAGVPAEQRAWFLLRLADHDMRHGAPASADSLLRQALAVAPEDRRVLGTLARLEWSRGRWAESAGWGERAVARALDPATLATLSDDYAALGDSARAAELADAMRAAVMAQTGPLHRAWSLFLLDRGEDRAGVLARARAELRTRRDVYGYDVEAWALHALGRDAEAWEAAGRAIAQGTEDATIEYHAGVIAHAVGRPAEARAHLARALAIDPHFHPRQAADARARLTSLGDGVTP